MQKEPKESKSKDDRPKITRAERRKQREEEILRNIEEDRINQHTPKNIKSRLFEHERNSLVKKIKRDRKEAKSIAAS